jgi:hypothetical protein
LIFIQSLIRVVFSKEKKNYIINENYEYNFLKYAISKNLSDIKTTYGDNYTCLFRKDEINDDIIKYLFFIFGNSLLLKSFGNII